MTACCLQQLGLIHSALWQEWQQEDFIGIKAEVMIALQQVQQTCQQKDPDLWPEAVTAAFNYAAQGVPGQVLHATAAYPPAGPAIQQNIQAGISTLGSSHSGEEDLLVQLCGNSW